MSRRFAPILLLSRQSVGYGLGIFGRQLALFLALPLFTRHMPREEFGIVALSMAFLAFINVLSNAGMPAATFRFYNDSEDQATRRGTLGAAQVLFVGYAVLVGGIVFLGAGLLGRVLLGSSTHAAIIRIVAVHLVLQTLVNYGAILLRLEVRPVATSIQALVQVVLQQGLALVLVVQGGMGATGYWLGQLGGGTLGLALMLWMARRMIVFGWSQRRLVELMRYGIPLLPATLSMWTLRLADRALVTLLGGLPAVAVYEVGYRIGSLVSLATAPFNAAWPQFAFSNMHRAAAGRMYRNVLSFVAGGYTFVALVIVAFRGELMEVLAPGEYAAGTAVVPWVAAGFVLWGTYPVVSIGLKIAKRTSRVAAAAIAAATVNVAANVILIPALGITGAAMATLAAYGTLTAVAFVLSRSVYPISADVHRLGVVALAATLIGGFTTYVGGLEINIWLGRGGRLAAVLLFPALLTTLRFVSWKDLGAVLSDLRRGHSSASAVPMQVTEQ